MSKFINPIVPAPHADPWVLFHEGAYYYCFSRNGNELCVAKADRLSDLGHAAPICVYTAPEGTAYSKNFWAPELHYMDGSWVIYVAADDGHNAHHRMYALMADGPQSAFRMVGKVFSPDDHWAIDGTVLSYQGHLYFIWSGWEGNIDISQQLYIAPMSDPVTICGNRVCISRPEYTWERHGQPTVNEGPAVLVKGGTVHIVYSASGSWTDDYCLGLLTLTGTDPLNASAWGKAETPLFTKAETAYGPGHCSFTTSPDGSEDWIVYHANEISNSGWRGRSVRAQKFTWQDNTIPIFGTPVHIGVEMTIADEYGPL